MTYEQAEEGVFRETHENGGRSARKGEGYRRKVRGAPRACRGVLVRLARF